MSKVRRAHGALRAVCVATAFIATACVAVNNESFAQFISPEVENRSDQLDVPFVPSDNNVLTQMFTFAKPTKDDFVVDLGSGDGRIVITAAKQFGAQGFGVDLNEGLVEVANARAAELGVADRAKFYVRDLFKEDISRATIVTMYLLPDVVLQLRPKLFALKPGTRIVSHDYHLADWRPDAAKVVNVATRGDESIVYHWVVPAKVGGTWEWTTEYRGYFDGELKFQAHLAQHFQDIEGKVELALRDSRIHDATLAGAKIAFSTTTEIEERVVRLDYVGTVTGDRIEGTVRLSGAVQPMTFPWSARRVKATN